MVSGLDWSLLITSRYTYIECRMVEKGVEIEAAKKLAPPVARVLLGTATEQDIHDTTRIPESRVAIEAETGIKLPYTDKGVKNALDVHGARVRATETDGIVREARDEARELATQMLGTNLEGKTTGIFRKGMEGVDFDALPEYVEGFNLYYEGGAVGYGYGNIPKTYDRYIPETVKMAIYHAGKRAAGQVEGGVKAPAGGEIWQEKQIDDAGALRYTLGNAGNGNEAGGATTLKHKTTSGVELVSNPKKTTTILGRYDSDTKNIIKELDVPKNMDFSGNKGGFNLLNTPDELYKTPKQFWDEYNKPFLDSAISRGDDILMSTPINNSTLYTKTGELTGYGKEYFYLKSKGYEYLDGKMILKGE